MSKGRIAKYILHLKKIGEHLGVTFKPATRKDIEHFVGSWLYEQGYSAGTMADYIMVLKRFYKFLRSGNVDKDTLFPDEIRWLKKTIKPNERREPDFLTPEDVELLIKAAETIRDKAMICSPVRRRLPAWRAPWNKRWRCPSRREGHPGSGSRKVW